MGESHLLVDTDVLIAYLNRRSHREYLEDATRRVYYSAVTKKELLSKPGLRESERGAILTLLKRFRQIRIDSRVARTYSDLRSSHTSMAQADALVAATALARKLPLLTQNVRHFAQIEGLLLVLPKEPSPVLPKRRRMGGRRKR